MDSEMTWLYIGITVWGILMVWLIIWAVKKTLPSYLGELNYKHVVRTQPLTSATIAVGEAFLFKEQWNFPSELEPIVVKVCYKVKERKPLSIVFVRQDNEVKELSYQQVDTLIDSGVITDF